MIRSSRKLYQLGNMHEAYSEPAPAVAKYITATGHIIYILVGTEYGHLHTTSGGLRYWKSYSGARRALIRYLAIQNTL